MAATIEWEIKSLSDNSIVLEPFSANTSVEYEFRYTNTSEDYRAANIGFYIKEAETEGELEFPSSEGVTIDWYEILQWAEADPTRGLFVYQNGTPTQFTLSDGVVNNPIPLSIGTGTDLDEVEPGASVDITFKVVAPASISARRLYFTIELKVTPQLV